MFSSSQKGGGGGSVKMICRTYTQGVRGEESYENEDERERDRGKEGREESAIRHTKQLKKKGGPFPRNEKPTKERKKKKATK
jgi:hypothetical protein